MFEGFAATNEPYRAKCLVGGRWSGEPTDAVANPATGDIVGYVPDLEPENVSSAIEAAGAALKSWSSLTGHQRGKVLANWHAKILSQRDMLARILTAEEGKPLAEAFAEIDYAASFVEFFASEASRVRGETIESPRSGSRILVTRQPVGVVAAITPWNFPAAMVTRKIAPALAAGCTIVLKPAPETPLTALALAALAEQAGVPAGVLNVVTGDAVAIGQAFLKSRTVKLITFTGSTQVGKLLMREAAETLKKVSLELGGNAPFIVFKDADLDAAVDGLMAGKFRNMGQTCVCPNRVFVDRDVHDEFLQKLVGAVQKLRLGNGSDEGVTQGPLINERAVAKVERHVRDAVHLGAKVRCGGRSGGSMGGLYYEPTVISDVTPNMILTQEETFGPVIAIERFSSEHDVIERANATNTGLAGYFYTKDLARAFRVGEALNVGMVGVNTSAISVAVAPFGGVKESGIGREGSHHGILEFTELKYTMFGGLDTR